MPFVKVIMMLLALMLIAGGYVLAAPMSIKFSHSDGQDSIKGKASDYFKRLVEQRTDNRILIRIDPNSAVSTKHLLEALKDNSIQMAAPEISESYSINPQLRLFDLPFLFNDSEHLHKVLDTEVGTKLLENASQEGLIALSFWDNGFRQLTANRSLIRPQQVEGLKFLVNKSEVLKEQLVRLGAKTQTIPQIQLYTALNEKKIDGQENTLATIYDQKFYQVQSNLTLSNHIFQGYMVVTNIRFWSQLPEDLKVIIKGAIKDAAEYTRDMAAQINDEALTKLNATAMLRIDKLSQEEKTLWFKELKQLYPGPYKKITKELVRKAREEQIR